jgi:hypothetical protein
MVVAPVRLFTVTFEGNFGRFRVASMVEESQICESPRCRSGSLARVKIFNQRGIQLNQKLKLGTADSIAGEAEEKNARWLARGRIRVG